MKSFYVTMLAAMAVFVPSCSNWADPNYVSANEIGAVSEVVAGTVVSAQRIRIDAGSSDKNLGTGLGAAVGAGAGQLLGGGSGRIASTVGFGVVGALAGRSVGKYANQADGQLLMIQADKGGKTYQVKQPVYQGIGEIPVGAHGYLSLGSRGSSFRPDGY